MIQQKFNISNYNSNGDVDRGHIGTTEQTAVLLSSQNEYSKRNGKSGVGRRYNNFEDDEDEEDGDGYRRGNIKAAMKDNFMDDEEENELERGGGPLSLDELDGWMNDSNETKNGY